jgi:hypothetical protein
MNEIKAIETHYKGCRFRSRVEARWAVFFDSLGLKWEYEKEGFELPSGRYLPDFWVSSGYELGVGNELAKWIEIKGQSPSQHELQLLKELSEATRWHSALICGSPWEFDFWSPRRTNGEVEIEALDFSGFLHCFPGNESCCRYMFADLVVPPRIKQQSIFRTMRELRDAIEASRSARFEFGETHGG